MVGAVLGDTVDQFSSKYIEMQVKQHDAPTPNPPIVVPQFDHAGVGNKWRSRSIYKKTPKRSKYSYKQRPSIYNF